MRNLCEGSLVKVQANADGRGTCPLCGTSWHVLTRAKRLRPHRAAHDLTAVQIAIRLADARAALRAESATRGGA